MTNTITEALIYENQGLINEAKQIYRNILADQPDNFKAAAHLRRLNKDISELNKEKLELFLHLENSENLNEFKRWLIQL